MISRKEKIVFIGLVFFCILLIVIIFIPMNRIPLISIIFYSSSIIAIMLGFWLRNIQSKREKQEKKDLEK